MTESEIQNTICEYLERKGHFFWRSNNTPVYDPKTKRYRRMPKYGRKGVPDIIVIWNGYFVGLEVKKPKTATSSKTYQDKDQKKFESECKEAGGEYYVVRSIENLVDIGL